MPDADAAIAEAAAVLEPGAPVRQQASLAMAQGQRALGQRRFADAAEAFRRQAALYREEGSEFGEYLALLNLSSVSLDMGEIDDAIEALNRATAGLRRIRAPYGLGAARAFMAIARAVRGDDASASPVRARLRDAAAQRRLVGGQAADGRGDVPRAPGRLRARGADRRLRRPARTCAATSRCCPIDERLQREVEHSCWPVPMRPGAKPGSAPAGR